MNVGRQSGGEGFAMEEDHAGVVRVAHHEHVALVELLYEVRHELRLDVVQGHLLHHAVQIGSAHLGPAEIAELLELLVGFLPLLRAQRLRVLSGGLPQQLLVLAPAERAAYDHGPDDRAPAGLVDTRDEHELEWSGT